ncbi:hypothetical protein [Clostridium butyricum]|uniref:hypothetical protein n=1 Tax=Clostridium butyricum TaxID=1492 RepID=UPI002AB0A02A|nr:hypothetical protein [Clostridium butyricum]
MLSGVLNGDKKSIYKFLGALSEETGNEDENKEETDISEKINYLLQVDFDKFYNMVWIKRTLATMIERNVKELCSGKFFIEGDFKTICQEPLGILNFVMNRRINGSLKANQFWCNTDVNEIMACRFPIASFSEVGAMNFVQDNLYDKYCRHWTKELCVFNAKDIRAAILSGADFDTDTIFTTSNEIMINGVISPKDGLYFISTENRKSNLGEVPYNWNVRVAANTMFMGNIIGQIAVLNACISNCAQDLGVYHDGQNITFKRNCLKERMIQEVLDEEMKKFWNWCSSQENTMNLSREIVKEIITNQFYELEEVIYKTVEVSMIAIDAPKTGILPDLDFIKKLKKDYNKPYYFKYVPGKSTKAYETDFFNNSILESYAKWNEVDNDKWKGILARVEYYKHNSSWINSEVFHQLFNVSNAFSIDETEVEKALKRIEESFQNYKKQRKERDRKYIKMKEEQIPGTDDFYETNEPLLDNQGNKIKVLFYSDEVRSLMTKTMCFKAERDCIEICNEYNDETICNALFMFMNKRNKGLQRFVFDFYFKYIELMCGCQYSEYEVLVKSNDSNAVEILFDDYVLSKRKLKTTNIGNTEIERFCAKNDIQSLDFEFRFGCTKDIITDLGCYVTLQLVNANEIYVISETGEKVGKIYSNVTNDNVNLYKLTRCKLIIKEFKENNKSYTIWIKGIEV